jgi:hypothetical protein
VVLWPPPPPPAHLNHVRFYVTRCPATTLCCSSVRTSHYPSFWLCRTCRCVAGSLIPKISHELNAFFFKDQRARQKTSRLPFEDYFVAFLQFNVHGFVHCNNILLIVYIQQDVTLHSLFYLETALHVSGGTTTHHQECKQLCL